MEFSWRTVMLLLGIMMVVLIVFDGLRRMRRNREASLRLDIKKDFKFPSTTDRAEFPSGGFRVIVDKADSDSTQTGATSVVSEEKPLANKESVSAHAAETAVEKTESSLSVQESFLPDYRDEPFFSNDKASKGGSLLDPDIGASLFVAPESDSSKTETSSTSTKSSPEEKSQTTRVKTVSETAGKTSTASGQEVPETTQPTTRSATASQPARSRKKVTRRPPIKKPQERVESTQSTGTNTSTNTSTASLEGEVVPVLMSVEALGKEETAVAMEALRTADEHNLDASDSDEPDFNTQEFAEENELDEEVVSEPEAMIPLEDPGNYLDDESDTDVEFDDGGEEKVYKTSNSLVLYANDDAQCLAERPVPSITLVIHVRSRDPKGFYGPTLLHLFNQCDLRFGKEGVFHRYEEAGGRGPIQFSVVQMVKPGVFDPDSMEGQHFHGLTFFMGLPGNQKSRDAFRAMSELAQYMSRDLDAELLDDSRSALGEQTLEHYRQQIIEHERQLELARKAASATNRR